ncbi:YebC/PmpR family DNA-binding transcriptional regulator [Candidatus Falkowbacteria bacterium CG23_combo_of_CG06-09_8_20_14_all_41_10]|uniref:Probable transcriptional regulatory protein COX21_02650 n=1 Tax=Candidatus Falkowbacteria bacterium CG23_combo_of_CG06-09_8_20_14_all_41_10 TaxID=1974571 RepID=A0A2G9ZMT1_9BACT|nr:MAG: YebC/PmpR family DNA-binding transcriptional regulator [Candidatus Falkowbacteria bacterium CG23_combo_of_CG06-09_8_20_14_all_41_10]
MSGHSKWATTHRQKEIVDAKRGAVFTKLANLITMAAKRGGDLNANPSLRTAVEKARAASIPKDNIERAIKKGTGELGGEQIEELYYEAIGPGNSQFVIKCVTDNKNRSVGNVRHIFTKNGGAFGNVLWNFEQKGVIIIKNSELSAKKINFADLELELIDAGVDDLLKEVEGVTIYTKIDKLQNIVAFLESKGLKAESAEIEYVAKEKQELKAGEKNTLEKIMEDLEDNEDVSDYYTNII